MQKDIFIPSKIDPGCKVTVVGAGHSGMAACRLLHDMGADIRLVDRNIENVDTKFLSWAQKNGMEILGGEHSAEQFADVKIIVLSPGVALSSIHRFVPTARVGLNGEGPEIMSETELAWRLLGGEELLAVTGTSGKTTTATLCAAMLREGGLSVFLGGNIGAPLSEYVLGVRSGKDRVKVLVLELSSFQLQTCSTLHPRVAVLTGLAPNHLDYHADMEEYISAKMRLFRNQSSDDLAVLAEGFEDIPYRYNFAARVEITHLPDPLFANMQLLGAHNQKNAQMAWLACQKFGINESVARSAAAAQSPIAHRLEKIGEKNGVLYVNDSKCTTVDALGVALAAFDRPVLLLAGGKFKGGDLSSLIPLLRDKVRAVALYGASRDIFTRAWENIVPLSWDENLKAATRRLESLSRSGDVILLAPATASYDQYPDYIARGEDFRRISLGGYNEYS